MDGCLAYRFEAPRHRTLPEGPETWHNACDSSTSLTLRTSRAAALEDASASGRCEKPETGTEPRRGSDIKQLSEAVGPFP
jgi:hypothetical protein